MSADRAALRAHAFAKINLELRIAGVRPDGYHELRTIFQSIALRDTLTFARRRGPFVIACDERACPTDRRNLVWRAAQALWRAAGRRGEARDVTVSLVKRIPMEAGLGGGSSDAAAALRALARLWTLTISDEDLRAIAASLGADVPYFLEGGTVLGLERGDVLFPLVDLAPAWAVVAVPPFGVSTKEAFGWWDERARTVAGRSARRISGQRRFSANDLEPLVAARHPIVSMLLRRLRGDGAQRAGLSGSGSAVFGLFSTRLRARHAADAVAALRVRTFVTRTLSRQECRRLAAK